MISQETIHRFLDQAASDHPERTAVVEPGKGQIKYRELAMISDRVRDRLHHLGVRPGERVGVYLHKSIDAVATIFGILKTGAAYVPVDATAPLTRNAYILQDCSVKAIVVEASLANQLKAELGSGEFQPALFVMEGTGGGDPLRKALDREQRENAAAPVPSTKPDPEALAYILYTSGSTGKPKGVILTHRNAITFIDWCTETFQPTPEDRFSSHAPFHFDLSILDIYLPIKHGATLVLVSETTGKDPVRLAQLISEEKLTFWYSTPSILSLLLQFGKLEQYDFSCLRNILFAGEVFPVKNLRNLMKLIPHARYFNLYGPTETNVCTYYEVPGPIDEEQTRPIPIGKVCSHLRGIVVDGEGSLVLKGSEGELCISGPGVTQGYWNLPDRTEKAFLVDSSGQRWYKTGDIVVEGENGDYQFIGRRDRMVKKRGYRVELGEIESVLYSHPAVKEAAVIALSDEDNGVRVKAFLSSRDGNPLSIIELKRYCAEKLPLYMVPDLFSFQDRLPKTSTDKIDYQRLKEMN